jgi:hypothetical protein
LVIIGARIYAGFEGEIRWRMLRSRRYQPITSDHVMKFDQSGSMTVREQELEVMKEPVMKESVMKESVKQRQLFERTTGER